MISEFGNIASKLARNPLGIIGLAFVLVYGIAGVVSSSDVFQSEERIILVWFMVTFPFFILIAFYLLVSKHHKKLYAPSDFKDDSNFLKALDSQISNSPKILEIEDITNKIKEEVEGQPLYKYTKLSECGKQLILGLNKQNSIIISEYNEKRGFTDEDIKTQIQMLSNYGWVKENNGELSITDIGRKELNTFIDLAYGRLA
ncbi:Oligopeptide transport system permease protein OppC (TC 3.A.1.5.1) [hydrothermal vent metagenome]|uniref:Oligopeptide transport system permease protein OppC (TC 3.A.1.5.1) n=1 Tax=hydrothermal vent metagenome TaxID=652676 RepID=A0A3B0TUC2_9ZZZZ